MNKKLITLCLAASMLLPFAGCKKPAEPSHNVAQQEAALVAGEDAPTEVANNQDQQKENEPTPQNSPDNPQQPAPAQRQIAVQPLKHIQASDYTDIHENHANPLLQFIPEDTPILFASNGIMNYKSPKAEAFFKKLDYLWGVFFVESLDEAIAFAEAELKDMDLDEAHIKIREARIAQYKETRALLSNFSPETLAKSGYSATQSESWVLYIKDGIPVIKFTFADAQKLQNLVNQGLKQFNSSIKFSDPVKIGDNAWTVYDEDSIGVAYNMDASNVFTIVAYPKGQVDLPELLKPAQKPMSEQQFAALAGKDTASFLSFDFNQTLNMLSPNSAAMQRYKKAGLKEDILKPDCMNDAKRLTSIVSGLVLRTSLTSADDDLRVSASLNLAIDDKEYQKIIQSIDKNSPNIPLKITDLANISASNFIPGLQTLLNKISENLTKKPFVCHNLTEFNSVKQPKGVLDELTKEFKEFPAFNIVLNDIIHTNASYAFKTQIAATGSAIFELLKKMAQDSDTTGKSTLPELSAIKFEKDVVNTIDLARLDFPQKLSLLFTDKGTFITDDSQDVKSFANATNMVASPILSLGLSAAAIYKILDSTMKGGFPSGSEYFQAFKRIEADLRAENTGLVVDFTVFF